MSKPKDHHRRPGRRGLILGLAGALLLLSGCMRQPPETNRFVPGDALYEQYTTRGKRLLFEGPEGPLLKVRLRAKQVRVYDSALRPVGRVRFEQNEQVRASTLGGDETRSAWLNEDVAELPGHWRVERADERWAIFDAQGQLLGLLHPPTLPTSERDEAQHEQKEAGSIAPTFDGLSADDQVLYAALTSPGAGHSEPSPHKDASDVSPEPPSQDVVAPTLVAEHSPEEGSAARGWSLTRDYRDRNALTIIRDDVRPRAVLESAEVMTAPAAGAAFSDAALLVLTLEGLAPLSRQALASWVDRNLIARKDLP